MKRVICRLDRFTRDFDGTGIVSFTIPNPRQIAELQQLDPNKVYSLEIKEAKGKRTLQQNSYLWKLITEIDKKLNGRSSAESMDEIYLDLLEKANAKVDFICCLPEAERLLKQSFRVIKYISSVQAGAARMNLYKVVAGSSKMNTKEMAALIDAALDYASQCGIETDWWEEMLR